jgi:hypothetical protein
VYYNPSVYRRDVTDILHGFPIFWNMATGVTTAVRVAMTVADGSPTPAMTPARASSAVAMRAKGRRSFLFRR